MLFKWQKRRDKLEFGIIGLPSSSYCLSVCIGDGLEKIRVAVAYFVRG